MTLNYDVLVPIAGIVAGVVLCLPIVRALVRFLDRKGKPEQATAPEELAEIRARLAALEDGSARLAEPEERQDFMERVLARQRDQGEIAGGIAGA